MVFEPSLFDDTESQEFWLVARECSLFHEFLGVCRNIIFKILDHALTQAFSLENNSTGQVKIKKCHEC